GLHADTGWRSRWGDRILLLPVILLGVALLLRPYVTFVLQGIPAAGDSLIDQRLVSVGWWLFLVLRFVAVVALARFLPSPFRGPVCGAIAATLVWLNPASVLDSMGWPQWEVWLPPWFLLAALLVSVDWWLTAGLALGFGCMFKGQLLFVAPLFILCPLFAGWIGRFTRIIAGLGTGMALVCWPWFVRNDSAKWYILSTVFAAGLICLVSIYREALWRHLRATGRALVGRARAWRSGDDIGVAFDGSPYKWQTLTVIAGTVLMLCFRLEPAKVRWELVALGAVGLLVAWRQTLRSLPWIAVATASVFACILVHQLRWHQQPGLDYLNPWIAALTAAIVLVPWFIPRRMFAGWMVFAFAASVWLGSLALNGSFSWWEVGFMYGTRKHDQMQLGGRSLSNLSSILQQRYRWDLHDPAATVQLTPKSQPIDLEVRSLMATMFFLTLTIIAAAAAVHLRRRDRRFLVTLVAAWMCFVALLPQLAARYTLFPAIVAAVLVAVSVPMSLFQVLLTTIACMMLGNQVIRFNPNIAPIALQMSTPTHPDFGWTMVALALVLLFASMVQTPRGRDLPVA
ncbi:MAG TPA: hypothetical protein VLI90_19635, partial [Tepidisphaeraceae bacterium]|nr:hypothetical protein [Tepidisphaeraceae bacterium]